MAAGAQVGSLRITLGASTANFEAGMRRARKEAATSATAIQRSLGGIRAGVGGLAAGLVGAGTISGLVSLTKRSLEYASSLGEAAQQLGISSESLQVFRYAATQVGVTQEQMDAGLAKLTRTIGEAAAGAKAQAETFNELGINVRDVNGAIRPTDEILRNVADALAKIKDPAARARIEVDLFGRAGQKLDTLLAGGSKAIDELRTAAHKLGIVLSDEQIQNADQTADKIASLNTVLQARIAGVVADNATAIYDLANSLATLAGNATKAAGAWLNYTKTIGGGSPGLGTFITAGPPGLNISGIPFAIRNMIDRARGRDQGITMDLPVPKPFVPPAAGGLNRITGGGGRGGGGRGGAEDAERRRVEALRDAAERERALSDAKADELRAQRELLTDYVERQGISHQLIDIEADQRAKEIDLAAKLGEWDAITAEQLKAASERLRILDKQKVNQEVELSRQEDYARLEDVDLSIQRDMLEQQAQLAKTQAERRDIELQILDVARREQQVAIDRLAASEDWADQEKARRLQLALNASRVGDTRLALQGTRGPLEALSAQLPTTAAQMNEALQMVAVEGLGALEEGILSVIDGTKSLLDAFRDLASGIIAELLRIEIQRSIIAPAANFLRNLIVPMSSDVTSMMAANPGIFQSGGFTGNMPTNRIAGFVHGREFVFDAEATRRIGVGQLEAIRKGTMAPIDARRWSRGGDTFAPVIHINAAMQPRQARETARQAAAEFQRHVATTKRQGY